jgi:hypothetical protein
MRHLALATLATALTLSASTSHAQIGRIRSAVTAVTQPHPAGPAKPVVIPITDQVVTAYLNALKARNQEIQKLAREDSPTGRYYAAILQRDSLARRNNDFKAETGPDWDHHVQLAAASARGDASAARELNALEASLDTHVDVPENDWNTQKAANAHMDTVMMTGSGLSAGEWAYLWDPMAKLVGWVAQAGVSDSTVAQIEQNMLLKPAEIRAVGARRIELARVAAWPYRTDAQIAAGSDDTGRARKTVDTNTYSGCLTTELKPVTDEAERRKDEFEAIQKSGGDMSKLLEFTNRFMVAQQAATEKCAPLLNH